MADQELRKLKRVELLEIMVRQAESVKELQAEMDREKEHVSSLEKQLQARDETIERLKDKLNLKDDEMAKQRHTIAVIYDRLKKKLDEKDETISQLQTVAQSYRTKLVAARSQLAELKETAILPDSASSEGKEQLVQVFENAKVAADRYLQALQKDGKAVKSDES